MRYLVAMLALVATAAGILGYGYLKGHGSGYTEGTLECKATVEELEATVGAMKSEILEAERQAVSMREKGRILADRAAAQAADLRAQLSTLQGRLDHAIASASRTQRGFDEQLTRLLNSTSEIRVSGDGLPPGAAAPGVDAKDPGVAANSTGSPGRAASIFSVATAMKECRVGYSACRAQLHGLIDAVEAMTQ